MAQPPTAAHLLRLRISPKERDVLAALVENYPQPVRRETMVSYLYGLDPNGGPLTAAAAINVYVHRLNKALAPVGWHAGSHGIGYIGLREERMKAGQG